MNKQRAQAIMEHITNKISETLRDWKVAERIMTELGLRCAWTKDLDQISIIILTTEHEEGIIVCSTGPDGVSRRHFRNVSSKSGEQAIKAVIRFSGQCRACISEADQ